MEAFDIYDMLAPVLMALVTWGTKELTAYLQSKTKNEHLRGAFGRLDDAILVGVKHTNQTLVRSIRKANADGKLTDDEKDAIKAETWRAVKDQFGGFGGLQKALKVAGLGGEHSVAKFVADRIEAHVHDEKKLNHP